MEDKFIYYLHRGDYIPFYVGITTSPTYRINGHKSTRGKDVLMEHLEDFEDNEWIVKERYWIKRLKLLNYTLDNKNNGGMGLGRNRTQDEKDKIGLANSKPKPKGFGNREPNPLKGSNKPKGFKGRVSPSIKQILYWGKGKTGVLQSLLLGKELGFDPIQISRVIRGKLQTHKKQKFIETSKLIKIWKRYKKIP